MNSTGVLSLLGLGLGAAIVIGSAVSVASKTGEHPKIRPRAQLDSSSATSSDCAKCHAEQAAQFGRSVMAHAARSPLFQSLEILIEEQVGRDCACTTGAGILRSAGTNGACIESRSGQRVTGSGGEGWCVNCHAPAENLRASLPAWETRSDSAQTRLPLRDLLRRASLEGVSCVVCHSAHGPVGAGSARDGAYVGNPDWTSTITGQRFSMRPEDRSGLFGISNSGYLLEVGELFSEESSGRSVHARPSATAREYLRSSEFCGGCHDVRLFGSDVLRAPAGEHFKRLRNAYSEWAEWARGETRAGRDAASCQQCHMSLYPGSCAPGSNSERAPDGTRNTALERACPPGTAFRREPAGGLGVGHVSTIAKQSPSASHYFTSVDIPLSPDFSDAMIDDKTLDINGLPQGLRQRRELLLGSSLRLELGKLVTLRDKLELPVSVENIGAGHRVPAGFSQEREIWVHLRITDARGDLVYEVGRVTRNDEDLHDKILLRVNTSDAFQDGSCRPEGLFGADVIDGPDVPRWDPPPELGARFFRGRGLINFQNGFLRCVQCRGQIDENGRCQPGSGQGLTRADRYADAAYDPDTGECRSNLSGRAALFETYFPVGALDASRGIVKAPDAIIDTRSLAPAQPVTYVYVLDVAGHPGPFRAEARLLFRAFPPYLIRAFVDYEQQMTRRGLRPSGPLIDERAFERIDVVELVTATREGS